MGELVEVISSAENANTRDPVHSVRTLDSDRDIPELEQAEILPFAQQELLEMIATGAALSDVLRFLVRVIEVASPECLGSILLLEGDRLRHGAAPSLPQAYNQDVDGLVIGPCVGSCGTAAFRGQPVVVEDIAHDPLWAGASELALSHGLRACWSTPIISRMGSVLGTFALYHRQPCGPTPEEERVVQALTHLAAIAIERQRADDALRESEERYRFLFAGNPLPMFIYDVQTLGYLDVNEAAILHYGYTRAELLAMTFTDILPPEDVPALEAADTEKSGPFRSGIWRHCKKDGTVIFVDVKTQPLQFEGRPARLLIARDITERVQSEEKLRASEGKYRTLVENLEQSIVLKDAQHRYVAANERYCKGVGLSAAELIGKTDFDVYPPQLAQKYTADDRKVLEEGRRLEMEEDNLAEGKIRTVRVVKTPVRDGKGKIMGVLIIFWDVTQQRALEAQLRQSQKMEAVGLLAGGIAHDFNNLLTAILGNVSLLKLDWPAAHTGQELLTAVERASQRAANLTRQLLGFSRRTLLCVQPINLHDILEEVVAILSRTIDPRIVLEVKSDLASWMVQADAGQMNQVVMNLCLNARDAMPDGGRLTLSIDNVILTSDDAHRHLEARPGEFMCLSIRDTGHGIPAEIRSRIFEPFFTTKGPGKGTGLGLAMVFGIVEQHQGWIECQSEPGQGTCFSIYLRRFRGGAENEPRRAAVLPAETGPETILLVDDEPLLRSLGRSILEQYGYEVLLAADGQEAVEIYRDAHDQIDLVILDLSMPRLSGQDAFHKMVEIDPKGRVLFTSGYAAEQLRERHHPSVRGFISKPFLPEHLAERVRTALDH
jgi:PAS domain S-box-containing protein